MMTIIWGMAIVLMSLLSAIAFPLTTYAMTLSTFGIARVAIELRYIDSRFHQRLGGNIEPRLLCLVLSIATLRLCGIFGWIDGRLAQILELSIGLGLAILATHHLYRRQYSCLDRNPLTIAIPTTDKSAIRKYRKQGSQQMISSDSIAMNNPSPICTSILRQSLQKIRAIVLED